MFSYENSITEKLDIVKLWDLYSNVRRWSEWDTSLDNVTLDGEFIDGTKGMMYMKNMPPLPFVLEEVSENKSFSNRATLGNIEVVFEHTITSNVEQNVYTVKHVVKISGDAKEKLEGIGRGITAAIPDSMKKLSLLSGLEK